jgi:hypothetical protein
VNVTKLQTFVWIAFEQGTHQAKGFDREARNAVQIPVMVKRGKHRSRQKLMKNDSQGPDTDLKAAPTGPDFQSHKCCHANRCRATVWSIHSQMSQQAKASNLQVVLTAQQKVFRFQVAMDDATVAEVHQCIGQGCKELGGLWLSTCFAETKLLEQGSAAEFPSFSVLKNKNNHSVSTQNCNKRMVPGWSSSH